MRQAALQIPPLHHINYPGGDNSRLSQCIFGFFHDMLKPMFWKGPNELFGQPNRLKQFPPKVQWLHRAYKEVRVGYRRKKKKLNWVARWGEKQRGQRNQNKVNLPYSSFSKLNLLETDSSLLLPFLYPGLWRVGCGSQGAEYNNAYVFYIRVVVHQIILPWVRQCLWNSLGRSSS